MYKNKENDIIAVLWSNDESKKFILKKIGRPLVNLW